MQDCKAIIIKHHQLVEVSITGTHCEPDQGAGTKIASDNVLRLKLRSG